jgi:tetratricopeptide (TPR) repeat protein
MKDCLIPKVFSAGLLIFAYFSGSLSPAQDKYPITREERSAYEILQKEERPVKAREAAESILRTNPNSFVGYYILGEVYARVEGSLPKAYYYLKKGQQLIESHWGQSIGDEGPWLWHARVIEELIDVTGQMDRYEEQLSLLDVRDRHYRPKLTWRWGWPLMKLGRMDEARKKMQEALTSEDPGAVLAAMNTLGAVEAEMDRPEASYEVFRKLIDLSAAKKWQKDATVFNNAAETALALMKFDEAENLLIESSGSFNYGTYSNPWRQLAMLYVREGRMPEAVAAVRGMQQWTRANRPALEQQSWAERNYLAAAVLLECGYTAEALQILRLARNRPDRRGGTSTHLDQSEAGFLLLFRHALKVHRETLAEEASFSPFRQRPWLWLQSVAEGLEMWSAGRRAAALIIENNRLPWSVRTAAPDYIDIVEWCRIDLDEILGPGVAAGEAARLLKRVDGTGQREKPYLELLRGYGELLSGSRNSARQLLGDALATLPSAEVYGRAQTQALLGSESEAAGLLSEALIHYHQALEKAPGVFRALALSLPCRITASTDQGSQKAAELLAGSPRFRQVGRGFDVRVTSSRSVLLASLVGPDGTVLSEASVPLGKDPVEAARRLCREFHRKTFSPKVDLSQTDIASLDGSNLTGDQVRNSIREVFLPAKNEHPPEAPSPTERSRIPRR